MTQHSVFLQAKMGDKALELLDEQVDGPERGGFVLQMGGTCVSNLVVEDDRLRTRQVAKDLQVIVGQSWTAMQDDERSSRIASKAESLVISFESLILIPEGRNSGVEGSRLRGADQRSGDEGESPAEPKEHGERREGVRGLDVGHSGTLDLFIPDRQPLYPPCGWGITAPVH